MRGAGKFKSARESRTAAREFEFVCDTQNVIISILRFSMKDAPEEESMEYALERILSAPFLPFAGKGRVFIFDEKKNAFRLAAGQGLSAAQSKNYVPQCSCLDRLGGARPVVFSEETKSRSEGKQPFYRVPIVYREKLLGVMDLFLKDKEYSASGRVEDFLSAGANVLAGILTRKNAERETAEIRSELRAAKRLADIGALAASVAHELRSPLAVIKMAGLNLKKKAKDPALDEHVSNIEKKIFECDRIINNLLFYAKLKEPILETVKLRDIILESIRENAGLNRSRGFTVRRNLSALKDVYVKIDPVQIKEVFSNILSNAFESRDSGGIVKVGSDIGKDGGAVVIVEDNGRGMSSECVNNIFTPFFTTKATGNGLGLTVAEQIVRMHGGVIGVESKEGRGSIFRVSLPVEGAKK